MQNDAAKKLIRDTFERPFDKEQFTIFARNLFNSLEPAEFPKPITGEDISTEFRPYIGSYNRIGKYEDSQRNKLDVLVVKLSKNTNLERARSAQRKFVAKYLKESQRGVPKDAAIVAFVSPDGRDWRFSFVKMDYKIETTAKGRVKVVEELTPARRYSFLVGSNENSHTAQSRLLPILGDTNSNPTIDQIKDAFSVDAVTKEFFTAYRALYEKVNATLGSNRAFRAMAEKQKIDISSFAKKLLGQIVFLYFLQKKGWLGVAIDKSWGEGDKFFMRTLFTRCKGKKENFYNDYLEVLFYDTLNNPRSRQVDRNFSKYFGAKVPFLNGGLFEPDYDWENTVIQIDNNLFAEILDVFDRYNFTVKEDEPLEKEVAVDPEMLGKVFENLLEENLRKGKGTYYTPREIVHYMCQETLISYLAKESGISYEKIRDFMQNVALDGVDLPSEVIQNATALDRLLRKIKVVDPACGSGAFLVGMLQEIVRARQSLKSNSTEYQLKKTAIQDCIYGVDIDPGAVDIAKLRLWLSLVVDYQLEEIEPLPNLDYKVMQGNSLLEEFEGVPFYGKDSESQNGVLFADPDREEKKNELREKKLEYFSTSDDKAKATLRSEINKLIDWFVKKALNEEIRIVRTMRKAKEEEGRRLSAKDRKKHWGQWADHFAKEESIDQLLKIIHDPKGERPFFLWELNFMEVFDGHDGFDIVIANPPYLKERDNKTVFEPINASSFGSKYHQGKMDYWFYFLHKAIDITKPGGHISYITSRYWLNSGGASKLIERVRKELAFVDIVDIGKLRVFDNVAGQHMVAVYCKSKEDDIFIYKRLQNDLSDINSVCDTSNVRIKTLNNSDVFSNSNEILFDEDKLEWSNTTTLGMISDISQGVVEAPDKLSKRQIENSTRKNISVGDGIFVLSESELNSLRLTSREMELIHPYLDPNDVHAFSIRPIESKYLIYADQKGKECIRSEQEYRTIKKHLDRFKDFITSSNGPYGLHRPRSPRYFSNPKILFKNMFTKPGFALDTERRYVGFSFSCIAQKDKAYDLKYLLAILNSTIASYWFRINGKQRGAGLDIGVEKLRLFPIAKASLSEQQRIIEIVDHIHTITSKPDYHGSAKERDRVQRLMCQIDDLLCVLYNFNPEEIKALKGTIE